MQGWRKKMEDSHISDMGLGPQNNIHIFGVFDGHGGKNSLLEVLWKTNYYKFRILILQSQLLIKKFIIKRF